MTCVDAYIQIYHKQPVGVSFCPYRVAPLGAHTDHQNGKVNGFAIDKGIHIAYNPKQNGIVELVSLDFPKRAQFHVAQIEAERVGDWADHMRGAAKMLAEKYPIKIGLSGVIEGSLPIGGLSSSAAVIIAFLLALSKVNGIKLDAWEVITLAKDAENKYVGVNCGKLDQSCEVLCKKDHLLYLDCLDDSYSLLPKPRIMKPFAIAVFFSGLDRSLASSNYNLRLDECKAAAYNLLAYAGLRYGKFKETRLRQVPYDAFQMYKNRLPEAFRKRAEHFFSESDRVQKGIEAWQKGELETYGSLMFESGKSSIENYECGCPELITLYNIMTKTDGIYGGRFAGAGFKGCCITLIDPAKEEEIIEKVTKAYLKEYPVLEEKYSAHVCNTANGVEL